VEHQSHFLHTVYNDSPIHTKLENKNAVTNCIPIWTWW